MSNTNDKNEAATISPKLANFPTRIPFTHSPKPKRTTRSVVDVEFDRILAELGGAGNYLPTK